MTKKIEIPLDEYRTLLYAQAELMLLESGGVDNWDWYSESLYNKSGEDLDDLKKQIDDGLKQYE